MSQESFDITDKGIQTIFHDDLEELDRTLLREIMAHPQCNRTLLFRKLYRHANKNTIFNRIRMLAYNDLITANWPPKMFYTPDSLTSLHLPKVMWGFNHGSHIDLEEKYNEQAPFWVFWHARRSLHEQPPAMLGNFSYTQQPMGALGLLHQTSDDHLPNHNFIEDLHKTESHNHRTALQTIAAQRGQQLHQKTQPYWLLPVYLHEIPQRLIRGWPLYPSILLETTIWKLQPPS